MIVTMAIRSQGQHVTPVIGGGVSWPWEKYTADNKKCDTGERNSKQGYHRGIWGTGAPAQSRRHWTQSAQFDPSAPGLRVQLGSQC